MTTTPQAHEDLQALVGPGQQDVFDQFLEEIQQQQAEIEAAERQQADDEPEEKLLAGKFKNAEELEKAYLEAQKLISSRGQKEAEPEAPAPLTREQAAEHYGEFIANAADEEGIDLGAWDAAVRQGQDTKELRDKLAAKTGIPVQLIEQYEQAYRPQAQPAPEASENGSLSDTDVAELKALVGGDEQFQKLSQWAANNLSADELGDYNAAVDSGNKQAVRLALRAMQARAATGGVGEPELIGGGKPATAEVFESQHQAIEAMRKTNSKGQRLYNVDPKYKDWYEKTLARSTFA